MYMFCVILGAYMFVLGMIGYYGFSYLPAIMVHVMPVFGMYTCIWMGLDKKRWSGNVWAKSFHVFYLGFCFWLTMRFSYMLDVWYKTGSLPAIWTNNHPASYVAKWMAVWIVGSVTFWLVVMLIWDKWEDYRDDKRRREEMERRKRQYQIHRLVNYNPSAPM